MTNPTTPSANSAVFAGPALVVVAIPLVILGPVGFLLAIGVSRWQPGPCRSRGDPAPSAQGREPQRNRDGRSRAPRGRARANPCTANPAVVAIVSFLMFEGTLLGSVAAGRFLAKSVG